MTDNPKQDFQDYLERTGVIDTLTQGLSLIFKPFLLYFFFCVKFLIGFVFNVFFSTALVDLYEDPGRNSDGLKALKQKLKLIGGL
jgi:hypothetical protein